MPFDTSQLYLPEGHTAAILACQLTQPIATLEIVPRWGLAVQPTSEIRKTSALQIPLPQSQLASSSVLKSAASRRILVSGSAPRTQLSIPGTITENEYSVSAVLGAPCGPPFDLQMEQPRAGPHALSCSPQVVRTGSGEGCGSHSSSLESAKDQEEKQDLGSRGSVMQGDLMEDKNMDTTPSNGSSGSDSSSELGPGLGKMSNAPRSAPAAFRAPPRSVGAPGGSSYRDACPASSSLQSIPEATASASVADSAHLLPPAQTSGASHGSLATSATLTMRSRLLSMRNFHIFKPSTPYTM
jgi:hypothetical protein